MKDNRNTIKKLQMAINTKFGEQLLYERRQFYSTKEKRPINIYTIKKSIFNPKKGKDEAFELFKSASQIQVILYLRDYWFELNGWDIPIDNPEWNMIKAKKGLVDSVLRKEELPYESKNRGGTPQHEV